MPGGKHTGPKLPSAPAEIQADEPRKPQHFFGSLDESSPLTDSLSATFAISPTVGEAYRQLLVDRAAALVAATTKYTEAERAEWLNENATLDASTSKTERARAIASRRGLPDEAVETIRRVIPARKK